MAYTRRGRPGKSRPRPHFAIDPKSPRSGFRLGRRGHSTKEALPHVQRASCRSEGNGRAACRATEGVPRAAPPGREIRERPVTAPGSSRVIRGPPVRGRRRPDLCKASRAPDARDRPAERLRPLAGRRKSGRSPAGSPDLRDGQAAPRAGRGHGPPLPNRPGPQTWPGGPGLGTPPVIGLPSSPPDGGRPWAAPASRCPHRNE